MLGIIQLKKGQQIALVCFSIYQAVLCYIFWGLGEKKPLIVQKLTESLVDDEVEKKSGLAQSVADEWEENELAESV